MPTRLTTGDFDQGALILFDARVRGNLSRRGFLDKAQRFAKAGLMAGVLLAILGPEFATGQQASAPAAGATAPPRTARVRGTIESVTPQEIVVRTRGGERVTLALSPKLEVTEIYPVALAEIKQNSFIGAAAMPQADGTQRAIAVTVFPEAFRGRGEGHRPFDFMPESTMTNGAVAELVAAPTGNRLRLRYAGGEKVLVVAPDTPVVSFKPGDRSLIVLGASVSIMAALVDGEPTAARISAGRDGFAVPY